MTTTTSSTGAARLLWPTTAIVIVIATHLLSSTVVYCKDNTVCDENAFQGLFNVKDFEAETKRLLLARNQSALWANLYGGSLEDETIKQNLEAFRQWRLRPHVLRDVSSRSLETTVLGKKVSMPFGTSPSALHKFWHPEGEAATARAVADTGNFMLLALAASVSIEDVAAAAPNAVKWFQMLPPSRDPEQQEIPLDLMRRAEAAGFSAIVILVDRTVQPLRYTASKENFDYSRYPLANFEKYNGRWPKSDFGVTWKDIARIKNMTRLPIVFKGILTAEDAREAVRACVDGIIVSNHGGRELDGSPATIEALPEIVKEVGGKIEVYLDGGIRSGKDVFKALALGARAVMLGRAVPFGLTVGGTCGVKKVLGTIAKELDTIMAQTGCATIRDIKRNRVGHTFEYAQKAIANMRW